MDCSSLFLVRVWPRDTGFSASVRRASDERTHHFDRPEAMVEHLTGQAAALRDTPAGCLAAPASNGPRRDTDEQVSPW